MKDAEILTLLDAPSESLLRTMLAASPCAASIGVDGKIVYANEACAALWGFDSGREMVDVPFYSLIDPEWHPLVNLVWILGANRSIPWQYELEGVRVDGEVFAYRITAFALDLLCGKTTFAYFEPIDECTPFEEQHKELYRRAHDLHVEMGTAKTV